MSFLKTAKELEDIWVDFDKLYPYFKSDGKYCIRASRSYSFTNTDHENIMIQVSYREVYYDKKYYSGFSVQNYHVNTRTSIFVDFKDCTIGYTSLYYEPRSKAYKFINEILSTEIQEVKNPENN